jgi:hypothetical protein
MRSRMVRDDLQQSGHYYDHHYYDYNHYDNDYNNHHYDSCERFVRRYDHREPYFVV